MHAERLILHTDKNGHLIERPTLPANATVEAIFLLDKPAQPGRRQPPASIARKGKTLGDIVSPVVDAEDWECLK